jgi:hypothetical protein
MKIIWEHGKQRILTFKAGEFLKGFHKYKVHLYHVSFLVCYRVCSLSKLHSLHHNRQALSQALQHRMDSQTTVRSGLNITAP